MRVSRSASHCRLIETAPAIANQLILLLDYSQLGLGYDGSKLVVHVDGTLELGGVSGAEGRWLAIGPVQDGLRGVTLAAQGSVFCAAISPRGCVFSNHQRK